MELLIIFFIRTKFKTHNIRWDQKPTLADINHRGKNLEYRKKTSKYYNLTHLLKKLIT